MNIFNPDLLGSIESSGLGRELKDAGKGFAGLTKKLATRELNFLGKKSDFEAPSSLGGTGLARMEFGDLLKNAINRVNQTQLEADRSIARLASGKEANIHQTMMKLEQADISLRYAMQIRSKLLEAYQEFMRMPV